MTGESESKTTEQLRADLETLRRQLATRRALPEWSPPAILSVPMISATQAVQADTPAPIACLAAACNSAQASLEIGNSMHAMTTIRVTFPIVSMSRSSKCAITSTPH